MSFYDDAAASVSWMVAFSMPLAASSTCSAPLVACFFSPLPLMVSASASRRSISAWALATFWEMR
jgi:hypothetical protein